MLDYTSVTESSTLPSQESSFPTHTDLHPAVSAVMEEARTGEDLLENDQVDMVKSDQLYVFMKDQPLMASLYVIFVILAVIIGRFKNFCLSQFILLKYYTLSNNSYCFTHRYYKSEVLSTK